MRGKGIGNKVELFAFCREQSDRQHMGGLSLFMLAILTSNSEVAVDGTCVACE